MSKILMVSLLTGLLVGSLSTGVQSLQVLPLIHQSEAFEGAPIMSYESAAVADAKAHSHGPADPAESDEVSEGEAWGPKDGFERLFFTWASNSLLAAGWAFLLCAAFLFIPKVTIRSGLLWGLFGYISFFAAPSLGLPPELPGMTAADLADRQIWWICTALSSIVGFCFLYFGRSAFYKAMVLPFILIPHFHGAPQPSFHGGSAPLALWKEYVSASVISNLISWLLAGIIAAILFRHLSSQKQRV